MNELEKLIDSAWQARRDGRYDVAKRDLEKVAEATRGSGPLRVHIKALTALAHVLRDVGDDGRAIALYEEAVQDCRREGDPLLLAHTVRHLGDLHRQSGRPEDADLWYGEALALYRSAPNPPSIDVANALRGAALAKEALGDASRAHSLWKEAEERYTAAGVGEGVTESRAHAGFDSSANLSSREGSGREPVADEQVRVRGPSSRESGGLAMEPHREPQKETPIWWKRGVVYEIYPRSFQDSDGDGIGDLRGIAQRLDYLEWLGIDALWISPIFRSPMADFGYDVADYCAIDPIFGTMEDFDHLLDACHDRGLKLLLDLVPNHTSDQHPWFVESRSSRDNPKRDWYIWKDPDEDGSPPTNWLSVFGGSAWEFDDATGQYYYHAFLKEQPDLNWRNPDVRRAMFDVMRFWFDKGVDGFRIDVLWHVIKDERFRDNPKNPDYDPSEAPYEQLLPIYSSDQPEAVTVAEEMRTVAEEYDGRVLIGEIYLPIEQLVAYYGREEKGIHLPFNFQLLTLPWDARKINRAINEYEGALPDDAWPNWVLGNHDKTRIATRVGAAQARVAAVMLLTLRGTPTLYYGDELGLPDVSIPPDRTRDPQGLRIGHQFSRDPQRTPMPWDGQRGFTDGSPWLPLNEDRDSRNVEAQRDQPDSMLSLYRRLLSLRRERRALSIGSYSPLDAEDDAIAFLREWGGDRIAVGLNLIGREQNVQLEKRSGIVLLSTNSAREGERVSGTLTLGPDEALVIDLDD